MTTPNDAPPRGKMRLFSRYTPAWPAGRHFVLVRQDTGEYAGGVVKNQVSAVDSFIFDVTGPSLVLGAAEVIAAYPPPESPEASDLMLPHVVLRRRTLPWERTGPGGVPWLALLLFTEGEARLVEQQGDVPYQAVVVKRSLLRRVLPTLEELPLLSHVRQLNTEDREAKKDDDGFMALVLGNRLPMPGKKHMCCLVSLDDRWKDNNVYAQPGAVADGTDPDVSLVSLYSWTFTAGGSGDFEAIAKALKSRRFGAGLTDETGHLSLSQRGRDGQLGSGLYRGPLVPLALERSLDAPLSSADALGVTADGKEVLSYASAFEVGRLLAESSQEIRVALAQIRTVHQQTAATGQATEQFYEPLYKEVSGQPIPKGPSDGPDFGALRDPELWVDKDQINGFIGDASGIRHLIERVPGLSLKPLRDQKPNLDVQFSGPRSQAARASLGPATAVQPPAASSFIDLDAADLDQQLEQQFSHVAARVLADIDSVG